METTFDPNDEKNHPMTEKICPICDKMVKYNGNKRLHHGHSHKTGRKLIFLSIVAGLALFSICIIGEKLISRHVHLKRKTLSSLPHLPPFAPIPKNAMMEIVSLPLWEETEDSTSIADTKTYWPSEIEARVPPGLTDIEVEAEMSLLRSKSVKEMSSPDWLHCGREPNRFIHFEDGTLACSRNRQVHFIQGEVMAFYLARLLGLTNTPVVVLSEFSAPQWNYVDVEGARWNGSSEITALIQWIPNLTKDTMPTILRKRLLSEIDDPIDLADLADTYNFDQMATLAQWGDLIIFDYLTGNYDRVASMQDAAEKERRPEVLKETIHNLVRSTETSSLWLIDNETSFLSAYSLMYEEDKSGRFLEFQRRSLRTICIFRKSTIRRLKFLNRYEQDPAKVLLRLIDSSEPLFKDLPKIHENSVFVRHFGERIKRVLDWVEECQKRS